ncbi:MAG: ANTAR domain-containing protein [Actinomycetota bacterium]|nr:ANTAR domain-containing protein [Actinomycetota bacterium]
MTEPQWQQDRARFVRDQHTREAVDTEPTEETTDVSPLAREFAALTRSLLQATTVADVLRQVVVAACIVIPAAHLASITLRGQDHSYHTPAQTDPIAIELDQVQYRSGRGPCVEAARPDGPAMAVSEDLSGEQRWPEFAKASARAGFTAVLATTLPDNSPARLPGALNLWSRERFVPADRDRALLLATHASLALATTSALDAAELERSQLRAAIASRDVIGQAKGILMGRRGLTAEDAFDVLRRTSQDINVKLVDLATALTNRPDGLDDASQ